VCKGTERSRTEWHFGLHVFMGVVDAGEDGLAMEDWA